jgi:DNA invertase Pin-like site-specific DNA recombinase
MKFAIYIRVSTEDQAKEGYSLEVQRVISIASLLSSHLFNLFINNVK